jgi:hypothetical protein
VIFIVSKIYTSKTIALGLRNSEGRFHLRCPIKAVKAESSYVFTNTFISNSLTMKTLGVELAWIRYTGSMV